MKITVRPCECADCQSGPGGPWMIPVAQADGDHESGLSPAEMRDWGK